MMKLQGKGKDWQEGQGDEACRFIYFESITGSCSKKEGISFVFVKYSNVCEVFFSRAHVCEAEIYPFFFGWNEPCQMRQEMISSSRSQSGEWGELLVPAAWHTLFVQGSLWCAAACQAPLNTRECLVGEKIWV